MSNVQGAYDALKYWGPVISAFVIVWKGFKSAEKGFQRWIEQILNGRIKGIQQSNEQIVALLAKNVQILGELKAADSLKAPKVEKVRQDLAENAHI